MNLHIFSRWRGLILCLLFLLIVTFMTFNPDIRPAIIIGILGGVFVIWFGVETFLTIKTIKNIKGLREKAFVIKVEVIEWIICIVFFILFFFYLPESYPLYIPLVVVSLFTISLSRADLYLKRKQMEIRKTEEKIQKN